MKQDFNCHVFCLFFAQVFHVCESGKRQSSFLCPRGTIFNQKHRVCDWWYNVKCEDSTEFYDLNLDLLLLDKGVGTVAGGQATSLDVPPTIDALAADDIDVFEDFGLGGGGGSDDVEDLDAMLEELGLGDLLSGSSDWDLLGLNSDNEETTQSQVHTIVTICITR